MPQKKYDVITIGGATRDFFISTNKGLIVENKKNLTQKKLLAFEYGAKIYSDNLFFSLGGGACNTAVGFSRLGLKTNIRICINKKREGEWIKKSLKKEGVDIFNVKNNDKEASGFSFIIVNKNSKGHDHIAFSYRGANKFLKINSQEKWNTKWIFLSSFSGKNWQTELNKITKIVKKNNIKLAFNPGSEQLKARLNKLKNILKITEVFIINRDEAIELALSKHHYNQAPHIKTLLRELYNYCPNLVVITDGSNGAYAYNGDKFYFQKSVKIEVVDTTGAGDGFSSGMISGLIKYKGDIKKSLKLGVKNGASVAKKMGAQEGLLRR